MKKVKKEGDSPTSHQANMEQSEAKQKVQPFEQMPTVPISTTSKKVKLSISLYLLVWVLLIAFCVIIRLHIGTQVC